MIVDCNRHLKASLQKCIVQAEYDKPESFLDFASAIRDRKVRASTLTRVCLCIAVARLVVGPSLTH